MYTYMSITKVRSNVKQCTAFAIAQQQLALRVSNILIRHLISNCRVQIKLYSLHMICHLNCSSLITICSLKPDYDVVLHSAYLPYSSLV